MGQSLDRIADSIREIQRLEGRLESLTSQGRAQARFMAVMPIVILFILMAIFPKRRICCSTNRWAGSSSWRRSG